MGIFWYVPSLLTQPLEQLLGSPDHQPPFPGSWWWRERALLNDRISPISPQDIDPISFNFLLLNPNKHNLWCSALDLPQSPWSQWYPLAGAGASSELCVHTPSLLSTGSLVFEHQWVAKRQRKSSLSLSSAFFILTITYTFYIHRI